MRDKILKGVFMNHTHFIIDETERKTSKYFPRKGHKKRNEIK